MLAEGTAVLVKANVGSGKTTVLTERVRHLHDHRQIPYEDMAVLTFTNRAAGEIRDRLGLEERPGSFGTFHSVALWLLREKLPMGLLGLNKDMQVIDPDEELNMALELIDQEGFKIKYKNRLRKRMDQWTGQNESDDLARLMKRLKAEKVNQNKVSFDDLIVDATYLLKTQPGDFHGFSHLIIDEVQDSDARQLEMIDALMHVGGKTAALFAVGDPSQVIYSWRGSALNVFYTLKERYGAQEMELPVNYRSDESILAVARKFQMSGAPVRGAQEEEPVGSAVTAREYYDPFQEAQAVAGQIRDLIEEGTKPEQIAVLYRLQEQAETLSNVFTREQIPWQVSIRRTAAQVPVADWLLRVLRGSICERDSFSRDMALQNPYYGGLRRDQDTLRERMEYYSKKRNLLNQEPQPDQLYEYFHLDYHLHLTAATYEQDRQDVFRLLEAFCNAEDKIAFLNDTALGGLNFAQEERTQPQSAVRMMTLHASKGLEFDHVFLIGVNDGILPLSGNPGAGGSEEEMRLFYVGITRARKSVHLSWYTNPGSARVKPGAGRFIHMIPEKLVVSDRKDGPATSLQDLRKMVQEEQRKNAAASEQQVETPAVETTEPVPAEEEQGMPEETPAGRLVRHAHYGVGRVVTEDDMMITVAFEGFGEKEFIKAFSELEDTV